jgi:hypothetical protein
MQTAESLYGLYVGCDDKDHEAYVNLKGDLEKIYKEVAAQARMTEHKGLTAHFMKLPSGKFLSFCAEDDKIHLGIYNRENHEIVRQCNFDDLKGMKQKNIQRLEVRSEVIVKSENISLFKENEFNKAWTQILEREHKLETEKTVKKDIVTQDYPLSLSNAIEKAQAVLRSKSKTNINNKQIQKENFSR